MWSSAEIDTHCATITLTLTLLRRKLVHRLVLPLGKVHAEFFFCTLFVFFSQKLGNPYEIDEQTGRPRRVLRFIKTDGRIITTMTDGTKRWPSGWKRMTSGREWSANALVILLRAWPQDTRPEADKLCTHSLSRCSYDKCSDSNSWLSYYTQLKAR